LKVVTAREEADEWRERYHQLRPQRDALSAELKEAYAAIPQLADVLQRIAALNVQIAALHRDRPDSESLYLHSPENVARGFTDFGGQQSLSRRLVLPAFDSDAVLWPPKQQIDLAYFQPQAYDERYTSSWWRAGQREQERKLAEQKRLDEEEAKARAEFWRPRQ
jgi:hypothetical protein